MIFSGSNLADDLGASSCTEVLAKYGKGFHLTGTLEQPMRYTDPPGETPIEIYRHSCVAPRLILALLGASLAR